MLNVTRTWNSVSSVAYMRRAVALARDYAGRRIAFGAPLSEKPLHVDTLAGMQAELEAALHLAFFLVEMLGREEAGEAESEQTDLLRLLTPIVKLTTGKQSVAICSEALECFGGAGYVEDTGLPMLLRDAQVFSIWEGTTNVLSLDALRAVQSGAGLAACGRLVREGVQVTEQTGLEHAARAAERAYAHAVRWFESAMKQGGETLEAGARRFALTLGRSLALALLCKHARWASEHGDEHPSAAAVRFAQAGVDLIDDRYTASSRVLGLD
jgi:hypothetical protein